MVGEYLWTTSNAFAEMRIQVEGAIVLYEEDAAPLYKMAQKEEMHEAATAFDTLGRALFSLREQIMKLEEACRQETARQDVKSNN